MTKRLQKHSCIFLFPISSTTTIMQRRNVGQSSSSAAASSASVGPASNPFSPRRKGGRSNINSAKRSTSVDISIVVLLLLAFILTAATYLFPAQVEQVEQEAEREMNQLLHHHGQQPPLKSADTDQDVYPPLSAMDSRWVDGEKKLKKRLEILAARQQQGLDIGVPVLTRWLGPDIPAWPTDPENTMPEDEWKKRVEAAYTKMREEEMEWRNQMTAYLEQELQGQG